MQLTREQSHRGRGTWLPFGACGLVPAVKVILKVWFSSQPASTPQFASADFLVSSCCSHHDNSLDT